MEIENCYYRVSVKALVLNEAKDQFLICKEKSGTWELPGGGLDWGTTPQEDLPREIWEEMGVKVNYVADNPSYFLTCKTLIHGTWIANVLYETKLDSLSFTPSDECVEIRFVNKESVEGLEVFPTVKKLAEIFKPVLHQK